MFVAPALSRNGQCAIPAKAKTRNISSYAYFEIPNRIEISYTACVVSIRIEGSGIREFAVDAQDCWLKEPPL